MTLKAIIWLAAHLQRHTYTYSTTIQSRTQDVHKVHSSAQAKELFQRH